MPIDYRNYSPDFRQISRRIRFERAGGKCEKCGIANYTVIEYVDECLESTKLFESFKEARSYAREQNSHSVCINGKGVRFAVVVLTTAHLDQDRTNDDDDNLGAYCQRCHLGHDRADNADRRRYGRTGKHYGQIRIEI